MGEHSAIAAAELQELSDLEGQEVVASHGEPADEYLGSQAMQLLHCDRQP